MQTRIVLLAFLAVLAAGCKNVNCGDGTTERDGACVPSNETVGTAQCGPFTELHGNQCVPKFPPTQCDPGTTEPDIDNMGVTTCIGTGAGGCSAKIACPAPPASSGAKQTICGQIYDFENNEPFAVAGATGTQCTPGATSGPCSLGIRAYDAVAFASAPMTTLPLSTGPVYIDDCGRYKVPDIAVPGGPFIALAIDDATMGPGGTTNSVGLATAKAPNTATKDFEAFIVRMATSNMWTGGPSLAAGIYAPIYYGHKTGTDLVSGVQFTFGPMGGPPPTSTSIDRDFYFASDSRTTLNAGASTTGVNGTALVSGATLMEIYSGEGALPAQCRWDIHPGAAVPFVVFVQIFRPINNGPQTCPL